MEMDRTTERYRHDEELEIDLLELCQALLRKWWLLVLGILAGLLLSGIYTWKISKPVYEASSMIYMRGSGNNTISSLQDLQIGAELTNDYEVIFRSRPILQQVIKDLKLDITYKSLSRKIELSNPTDTRILKITVKDHDAKLAADIVNSLVEISMDSVKEIDAKEPYLIEEAVVDKDPISPQPLKNLMLGALLGLLVTSGIVIANVLLNDRIRSVEDVESFLGLPVLCMVPESSSCNYEGVIKHNKKHSR